MILEAHEQHYAIQEMQRTYGEEYISKRKTIRSCLKEKTLQFKTEQVNTKLEHYKANFGRERAPTQAD